MVDKEKIESLISELLLAIGENPEREGLKETPARVARFWKEFIDYDSGKVSTAFDSVTEPGSQMVVVGPMRVWSLCEHHLLPFYADVVVGYIPEGNILGLSKFARIAHQYAHKLSVQERLVTEIAEDIKKYTKSENVAVIAYGEHLCMTMRGIKTPSKTVSSVVNGAFMQEVSTRSELFNIARSLVE